MQFLALTVHDFQQFFAIANLFMVIPSSIFVGLSVQVGGVVSRNSKGRIRLPPLGFNNVPNGLTGEEATYNVGAWFVFGARREYSCIWAAIIAKVAVKSKNHYMPLVGPAVALNTPTLLAAKA